VTTCLDGAQRLDQRAVPCDVSLESRDGQFGNLGVQQHRSSDFRVLGEGAQEFLPSVVGEHLQDGSQQGIHRNEASLAHKKTADDAAVFDSFYEDRSVTGQTGVILEA